MASSDGLCFTLDVVFSSFPFFLMIDDLSVHFVAHVKESIFGYTALIFFYCLRFLLHYFCPNLITSFFLLAMLVCSSFYNFLRGKFWLLA